jgi:signal peptidase
MRRFYQRAVRATVYLVTGSTVALALAYAALVAAGYSPVAVYSGSMRPTLGVGDLAFVRPLHSSTVRVGDVITFSDPYVPGRLVTHRVLHVLKTKSGPAYHTKGDANPSRDPWTIRLHGTGSRLAFHVPMAGYALFYARTREVRAALILVAAVVVLLGLLQWIWRPERPAVARS